MNMTVTLEDIDTLNSTYNKKLEISSEKNNQVRFTIVDNEDQGLSVVIEINDLRRALSAIKSLK